LSAFDNRLQELPPLPQNLRLLNVGENQLHRLPELPQRLQSLYIPNNQLNTLPDSIMNLHIYADVNIYNNP
ncbi:E3 ubiquitin--protein ligase, partial [Shigella flexneri]